MRKDFVIPIAALSVICFLMALALAAVNALTMPVIEQAALERADAARRMIIPEAEEFVLLDTEGMPKSVIEAYAASGGLGYIFVVTSPGYGGDIDVICGIDPDGIIIKTAALKHSETKGKSDPVFKREGDYSGKDRNLEGIDAIAGVTITSNAYKHAVLDAFAAFDVAVSR